MSVPVIRHCLAALERAIDCAEFFMNYEFCAHAAHNAYATDAISRLDYQLKILCKRVEELKHAMCNRRYEEKI